MIANHLMRWMPGVAIAIAGLLHTRAIAQNAPVTQPRVYVSDAAGNRPDAHLAIKGVCAWPNLTRLKDGAIIAEIFNQPSHGMRVGDVECWGSTDNGNTWSKRGVAAAHDPGTLNNRMNIAAGQAGNGDLIVVASGWTIRESGKEDLDLVDTRRAVVCRSTDGGFTWSCDKDAFPSPSPEGHNFIPHGNIFRGRDGALRLAAYSAMAIPNERPLWQYPYVLRSDDDGRTWSSPAPIDKQRRLNEAFIFPTGAGKWLAITRDKNLFLYESSDDARTWTDRGAITEKDCFPGHIMRLADGRLLMTNGNRTPGAEGVDTRISNDDGRTWSRTFRVVDWIGHDGGYPSNVQLPDGNIVTAFYARQMSYHDGYHMGVIVWSPEKTFGKP
jgi:hypothetical protein